MTLFTKFYLGFFSRTFSWDNLPWSLPAVIFTHPYFQKNNRRKIVFFLILEFSAGRLFGYLFFGLVFGFLGEVIKSDFIHTTVSLATLWLGILMIVYSLGSIDKKILRSLAFYQNQMGVFSWFFNRC